MNDNCEFDEDSSDGGFNYQLNFDDDIVRYKFV